MGRTAAEEVVASLASLYPLQKAEEEAVQEVLAKKERKEENEVDKHYLCMVELYVEDGKLCIEYAHNAISTKIEKRNLGKLVEFIETRRLELDALELRTKELFSKIKKDEKVYIKEEK